MSISPSQIKSIIEHIRGQRNTVACIRTTGTPTERLARINIADNYFVDICTYTAKLSSLSAQKKIDPDNSNKMLRVAIPHETGNSIFLHWESDTTMVCRVSPIVDFVFTAELSGCSYILLETERRDTFVMHANWMDKPKNITKEFCDQTLMQHVNRYIKNIGGTLNSQLTT